MITAPDGDYGHAVISRWPLRDTVLHDVSLEGREPRAAVETTVETPYRPAACRGGASRPEPPRAPPSGRSLAKLGRSGPARSLIVGDFNDWIWRGSVQSALAECMAERSHQKTFPAWLPVFALDRVYCRPVGDFCSELDR